ncbi:hypothetical protein HK101_000638 [Irineochytrium annulatum]|nr:hypothetical protein HK101_000638 [Irineochytrium annulatum]
MMMIKPITLARGLFTCANATLSRSLTPTAAGSSPSLSISWRIAPTERWAVVGKVASGKTTVGEALCERGSARFTPDGAASWDDGVRGRIGLVSFKEGSKGFDYGGRSLQERYYSYQDPDDITVSEFLRGMASRHIRTFDEGRLTEKDIARMFASSPIFDTVSHLMDLQLIRLSNGQMRRVRLARSFLEGLEKGWRAVVYDEPLMGLDVKSRVEIAKLLNTHPSGAVPILLLRPQDEMPDWITHVLELEKLRVVHVGERKAYEEKRDKEQREKRAEHARAATIKGAAEKTGPGEVIASMKDVTVIALDDYKILDNVNWEIRDRERWALVGPNGSGKTTLLSLLLGDHPQAFSNDLSLFGRRRGTGETLWDIRRQVGHVSPELHLHFNAKRRRVDPALLRGDPLTVLDAVAGGCADDAKVTEAGRKAATAVLEELGVEAWAERLFSSLSMGEQRVALIARCLVRRPRLLIMDEPFQGLDEELVGRVHTWLDKYLRDDQALIVVSHHQEEIPQCVSRKLRMEDGRVVEMSSSKTMADDGSQDPPTGRGLRARKSVVDYKALSQGSPIPPRSARKSQSQASLMSTQDQADTGSLLSFTGGADVPTSSRKKSRAAPARSAIEEGSEVGSEGPSPAKRTRVTKPPKEKKVGIRKSARLSASSRESSVEPSLRLDDDDTPPMSSGGRDNGNVLMTLVDEDDEQMSEHHMTEGFAGDDGEVEYGEPDEHDDKENLPAFPAANSSPWSQRISSFFSSLSPARMMRPSAISAQKRKYLDPSYGRGESEDANSNRATLDLDDDDLRERETMLKKGRMDSGAGDEEEEEEDVEVDIETTLYYDDEDAREEEEEEEELEDGELPEEDDLTGVHSTGGWLSVIAENRIVVIFKPVFKAIQTLVLLPFYVLHSVLDWMVFSPLAMISSAVDRVIPRRVLKRLGTSLGLGLVLLLSVLVAMKRSHGNNPKVDGHHAINFWKGVENLRHNLGDGANSAYKQVWDTYDGVTSKVGHYLTHPVQMLPTIEIFPTRATHDGAKGVAEGIRNRWHVIMHGFRMFPERRYEQAPLEPDALHAEEVKDAPAHVHDHLPFNVFHIARTSYRDLFPHLAQVYDREPTHTTAGDTSSAPRDTSALRTRLRSLESTVNQLERRLTKEAQSSGRAARELADLRARIAKNEVADGRAARELKDLAAKVAKNEEGDGRVEGEIKKVREELGEVRKQAEKDRGHGEKIAKVVDQLGKRVESLEERAQKIIGEAVKRVEQILPSLMVVKKDKHGKLEVEPEFWMFLKGKVDEWGLVGKPEVKKIVDEGIGKIKTGVSSAEVKKLVDERADVTAADVKKMIDQGLGKVKGGVTSADVKKIFDERGGVTAAEVKKLVDEGVGKVKSGVTGAEVKKIVDAEMKKIVDAEVKKIVDADVKKLVEEGVRKAKGGVSMADVKKVVDERGGLSAAEVKKMLDEGVGKVKGGVTSAEVKKMVDERGGIIAAETKKLVDSLANRFKALATDDDVKRAFSELRKHIVTTEELNKAITDGLKGGVKPEEVHKLIDKATTKLAETVERNRKAVEVNEKQLQGVEKKLRAQTDELASRLDQQVPDLNFLHRNRERLERLASMAEKDKGNEAIVTRAEVTSLLERELVSLRSSLTHELDHMRRPQEVSGRVDERQLAQLVGPMIKRALDRYSADVIGRADYALSTAGASIVTALTSGNYMVPAKGFPGWITGAMEPKGRGPFYAIKPGTMPGECWSMEGSKGQLGVRLAYPVIPTAFTIDHLPSVLDLTTSAGARDDGHHGVATTQPSSPSAPKDVELWVVLDEERFPHLDLDDVRNRVLAVLRQPAGGATYGGGAGAGGPAGLLVATHRFDPDQGSVQTFPVRSEVESALREYVAKGPRGAETTAPKVVVLRVLSNWGNEHYTCLYRFRVHGEK